MTNQRDLSIRRLRWGLVAAYVLHVLILAAFVLEVVPQQYHHPERTFWLHHGGDDWGYVSLAQTILKADFQPNKYPLGFPLLITPFMAIMGTTSHNALLPVISAFWSLVMFPVGQILLAYLAESWTGRRWLALQSVLIWTSLPVVFFVVLRVVGNASVAETYSVHLLWAQMLSDGPAVLFTLLVMAAFVRLRASPLPHNWAALLGVLCGFLALVRLTGALGAAAVGLALLLERRWRELGMMVVCALIVFAPQLVYQWHFFDHPLRTGYTALDTLPDQGLFHVSYLSAGLEKIIDRAGLLIVPAAIISLGIAAAGLRFVWRIDRLGAIVLGTWLVSYGVVYAVYYYTWVGGAARFLMPTFPAIAILATSAIAALARRGRPA